MQDLREHLVALLTGESAHANFESAIKDVPRDAWGKKPKGAEHSLWETLEHLRIAQWDILEYVRNPKHVSPEFPSGYWPAASTPPHDDAWDKSVAEFRRDLRDIVEMVKNKKTDLLAPMPHAGDKTILREVLLAADHNAYHIGQFIFLRKMLV
jgi:DinB family protein